MTHFFEFEDDFVASLRCIPMIVRYKLDTVGVKLKLEHWNKFSQDARQTLVEYPTTTAAEIQGYRDLLQQYATQYTDIPLKDLPVEEHPPWLEETKISETVEDKTQEMGIKISLEQWKNLTPVQRFALIKLSRPSHENKNFLPALREFKIIHE